RAAVLGRAGARRRQRQECRSRIGGAALAPPIVDPPERLRETRADHPAAVRGDRGQPAAAGLHRLSRSGPGRCPASPDADRGTRAVELGQVLQQAMEPFAQTGLPIRQFTGFQSQSRTLAEVDSAITLVAVIDGGGQVAFVEPPTAKVASEPSSGAPDSAAGTA